MRQIIFPCNIILTIIKKIFQTNSFHSFLIQYIHLQFTIPRYYIFTFLIFNKIYFYKYGLIVTNTEQKFTISFAFNSNIVSNLKFEEEKWRILNHIQQISALHLPFNPFPNWKLISNQKNIYRPKMVSIHTKCYFLIHMYMPTPSIWVIPRINCRKRTASRLVVWKIKFPYFCIF